ncbi:MULTISPECIES: RelA/SpoT family protein [Vogesella]|jgi:GTP pyrophosphokinase/guanosine-3',5'-bis(diphosphate) 3'-pyrophosphohydrolase|uniref:Bifunctional (P)ppGpp synthetase/guanosine-3',5'-bis(Diphosphate) 3'-pyrophosphohydrolase n=1 Tax=Vogesella indigofera TaxID=45465 RepID=A0A495BF70_VOGIN|nr:MULTISPECIES: bifunctional (p)ppGpp synthetase/guanosine-3',5'-bis(diphosphate) 3'-pyrophosphohydrolase [Vogesella]KMJ52557.1 guanosine-3',5'-bis(diphosphate) 3'-pyrophosphohydrolase [Vogesella sp. EB]MDC7689833.1 bifunctional (p)ppGpp synthetase/guanosine-3',5'-bis(diphosphate) 3'-pyrophosphohydrolase [Vogesella indigofera]MDC7697596.1 bifunctional (p)ppGpp synthetase/guanosine-3',5'-bis(diphosphate) 3'-pyrophosphohydrolase [Vogesella indigofera]RKQ58844.1 GTP pyrophosphokinase/guanosine-3'
MSQDSAAEHIDYNALVDAEAAALFDAANQYLRPEDVQLLRQAFATAREAHEGQTRKSGEPYITHPLAVAAMLTDWRLDAQGLAAALMHDVLEDTGVSKPTLSEKFGRTIADLVDGLSKLERLEYQTKESAQAENFRKMVLAMARDIRVIIVKLADRLHNMRTLDAMREDKRQRIALETLEIYAPIANRIGLNKVYRELQDLAFKHLHPHRYSVLSKAVRAARGNRREVVNKILQAVTQKLGEANIEATIKGREKNLYSIYKKMQEKHLSFSEVLDIYGFRIVVKDNASCYLTLGALHSLYKPIPGKFKDYIAIPKGNGYQSLHTTLFGPYGTPVEMQIRTQEMNAVAEAGVASHWMYKSGDASIDAAKQRTHQWLQSILDMQEESEDAIEFLEHIKIDLFPDEVYVFTPKGKIMVLPQGSTPVDFAYAVHTDIGHRCIAGRVNFNLVPLRTVLRNGDTVEIITSTQAKPNPSWLNFVQSGRARSGIRNYLKTLQQKDAVQLGEKLLRQAASALSPTPLDISPKLEDSLLHALGERQRSFNDLLADIGTGKQLAIVIARKLFELSGEQLGQTPDVGPVTIRGNEGGAVQLSSCCNPIPGDAIIGAISKGQGLLVHRKGCGNAARIDPEKLLEVNWEPQKDRMFGVNISVLAHNQRGALAEIAAAISQASANIETVDTQENHGGDGFIHIHFRLQVDNLIHLENVLTAIQQVNVVQQAERRQ